MERFDNPDFFIKDDLVWPFYLLGRREILTHEKKKDKVNQFLFKRSLEEWFCEFSEYYNRSTNVYRLTKWLYNTSDGGKEGPSYSK